jgi:hypothetical protein
LGEDWIRIKKDKNNNSITNLGLPSKSKDGYNEQRTIGNEGIL